MIASPAFAGKQYAVLGLARSGLASVASLVASGAKVIAWDKREEARAAAEELAGPELRLEDPLHVELAGFDGVVVSPGVPLNRHPIAHAARGAGVPLIGDIELFSQARRALPPHKVVAITGTNGKSTTTALVNHLLEVAGRPSVMGGNIGLPILGQEPLPAGGVYVLELSSYQIDLTHSLSADVAALINLSPDHLDRYDGFDSYVASKARLFAMQEEGTAAVFGNGDERTLQVAEDLLRQRRTRVFVVDPVSPARADWPSLQGPHNLQNAAVAIAIARILGLQEGKIEAGLASFPGLPHRMERLGEVGGVLFVNDSKATNPASTAPALAAFPPIASPRVHWIVGGLPKGDDLSECAPYFCNVLAAYTIGEAGPRFAEALAPHMAIHRSEMLAEAVRQAIAAARPGDVVLLSPACASFDQFRDYEARGDAFRQIVWALAQGELTP